MVLLYAVNICSQEKKMDDLRLRVTSLLSISDIDEGIFIQFGFFFKCSLGNYYVSSYNLFKKPV